MIAIQPLTSSLKAQGYYLSDTPCRRSVPDEFIALGVLYTVLSNEPVSFDAKCVDPVLHPGQQFLRLTRPEARPLQRLNVASMAAYLRPHALNFTPHEVEAH